MSGVENRCRIYKSFIYDDYRDIITSNVLSGLKFYRFLVKGMDVNDSLCLQSSNQSVFVEFLNFYISEDSLPDQQKGKEEEKVITKVCLHILYPELFSIAQPPVQGGLRLLRSQHFDFLNTLYPTDL